MSAPAKKRPLAKGQPPAERDLRWQATGICFLLAAITFAVFGQTLHHEFVNFDDNDYVYENPVVAQGLTFSGLVWAFTHAYAANWHPLTWLSHMLDCQLYGLNPGGHHLTNVLLHAATAILLFLVLRELTRHRPTPARQAGQNQATISDTIWRCALVAAVFAIHPLRVESVAWVAERKDVLSGLFFVLTLGAYARYARRPWSPARYGLVALLFALGLMCKPMLVTLPVVLLLLDYWPLRRTESPGRLVLEKLPLLALSAISCVITLFAQRGAIRAGGSFSLLYRLGNAVADGAVYLGQMVWPARLAVSYPYPRHGLPLWEVTLAGAVLASLSVVAWRERRRRPWLLTGWLWYLVMLAPVAGVIQVGGQAHADRYTYLPQIGVLLAATWLAAEWSAKRGVPRAAMAGGMTAVLAVLMVCAWKQTAYWQNTEALWTRSLDCTTGNSFAHFSLGNAFSKKGRLEEAIEQYRKALEIRPDLAEPHNNLGNSLFQFGRLDEAMAQYHEALEIKPDYAEAHNNLGLAFFQGGQAQEAMGEYEKALEIKADYAEARHNLGNCLFQQGRLEEAIAQYQKALKILPGLAKTHNNLGNCFSRAGRIESAIAEFQKALEIRPGYAEAHYSLGNCFIQQGRLEAATEQFQKALEAKPDYAEAQNELAWLLATCPQASQRNGVKALQLAQQANALTGGRNPVILRTLAAAYAETGRFGDALQSAQQALALARAAGEAAFTAQLNEESKRYEAGLPLHQ